MNSVLKQGEVNLRRLINSDAGRLAELANNKKIRDNLRDYFPHPYTRRNAEEYVEFTGTENPALTFGVEYKGDLVGLPAWYNKLMCTGLTQKLATGLVNLTGETELLLRP